MDKMIDNSNLTCEFSLEFCPDSDTWRVHSFRDGVEREPGEVITMPDYRFDLFWCPTPPGGDPPTREYVEMHGTRIDKDSVRWGEFLARQSERAENIAARLRLRKEGMVSK